MTQEQYEILSAEIEKLRQTIITGFDKTIELIHEMGEISKIICSYCTQLVDEKDTRIIGDKPACVGCQDRNIE